MSADGGGYGKIKNPYTRSPSSALPVAHAFADFIHSQGPARWGLERLGIGLPQAQGAYLGRVTCASTSRRQWGVNGW